MKQHTHVHILHNPTAGDAEDLREDLIRAIEAVGFSSTYESSKEGVLKVMKSETDLLVLAGGDGTVRKLVKSILDRGLLARLMPIILIPTGTANNFAKTLGVSPAINELEKRLERGLERHLDLGVISGISETHFFIESMGIGIFPETMKEMKHNDQSDLEGAEDKLVFTQETMKKVAASYKPKYAELIADGMEYIGNFLLIEVMNIQSIGPNLVVAPKADPSDGFLDLVIIWEDERDRLLAYLSQEINAKQIAAPPWATIKARNIRLSCDHRLLHVDDKLITTKKPKDIEIGIRAGALNFLT